VVGDRRTYFRVVGKVSRGTGFRIDSFHCSPGRRPAGLGMSEGGTDQRPPLSSKSVQAGTGLTRSKTYLTHPSFCDML
jgi:hypothetical protein